MSCEGSAIFFANLACIPHIRQHHSTSLYSSTIIGTKKLISTEVTEIVISRNASTLQMFTGNYRVFAGKSECGDFKFMGIACIPAIPVILKSPHSDFHCNICREFAFTGILWGFPALDVGKPCNNLIFGDIHAKFAGISCKF